MQPSVPTEAAPIVKPKLSQSPATVIPSTSTPPPTDVKENKKETTGGMKLSSHFVALLDSIVIYLRDGSHRTN